MKKSQGIVLAQIITAVTAAAAAYALRTRAPRLRQVVLITGGSRGLGLAIAERFARDGAQLVLAARNGEELERARDLLFEREAIQSPNDVLLIPTDLSDESQAASLIAGALAHFGRIDVLINNAGIIQVGPVEDQPIDAYHRAMQINFFAALATIHAALPSMLSRYRDHGQRSAIVNIASIGGKFAMPHLLPYVASKFALVGLSEGLHAELRHKGIRVTTVCPGLMRTGSHVQAEFTGDHAKEYRWFALGATTPLIAATTAHAAERIFQAVRTGRAEITITPQAWLAARVVGLAPAATQFIASLVNEYVLPAPTSREEGRTPVPGLAVKQPRVPFFPARSSRLRTGHNQS
ncbi:SDR family NAD(P)-dependent oxidoreductase [Granulicella sibirica]|uniref:3-oxoacyl-[acyl-carrier protein] reductase n=1 Tax=Granulicella sibirica TaxID=2479048 RepID=A0A4V1L5Z3_9BACT|nr:SDR family NAD(P)-dependent oxidoreductase [Granulicella sibirica]RXH57464.1 3-oxoacyl-[acyl-carrier protein] reductase [Granulicella sibirica]